MLVMLFGQALAAATEFESCMASASSQGAMSACVQDEFSRQDTRLNDNYAAAMAHRDAAGQATLRTAQRAWLTSRDAVCPDPGDTAGSLGRMEQTQCLTDETRKRADVLAGMAR